MEANIMLIKNGTVVTSQIVEKADIWIEGERIRAIEPNLHQHVNASPPIIDATDMLIFPGGVDPHTHMDLSQGDDADPHCYQTGTRAAAYGGTTTIIAHLPFEQQKNPLQYQVDRHRRLAHSEALVDYGFHGVVDHVDSNIIADLKTFPRQGITSVKFYMTYPVHLSDTSILPLLEHAKHLGILLCAHCENDAMIAYTEQKFKRRHRLQPRYQAALCPSICEAEAVYRLCSMARLVDDVPLYLVHISSRSGLNAWREARRGAPIVLETCPQYLTLDDDLYQTKNSNEPINEQALRYSACPPLRTLRDRDTLWQAIRCGEIATVATDHCPISFQEKRKGLYDVTRCPHGLPGIAARLPLLYTYGVIQRGMPLCRLVDLWSTNAAHCFGMYPTKGTIKKGCDADLVLFDPNQHWKMTADQLHEDLDYTPYEGITCIGKPIMTILRGSIIVDHATCVAKPGYGQYIHRGPSDFSRLNTGLYS